MSCRGSSFCAPTNKFTTFLLTSNWLHSLVSSAVYLMGILLAAPELARLPFGVVSKEPCHEPSGKRSSMDNFIISASVARVRRVLLEEGCNAMRVGQVTGAARTTSTKADEKDPVAIAEHPKPEARARHEPGGDKLGSKYPPLTGAKRRTMPRNLSTRISGRRSE